MLDLRFHRLRPTVAIRVSREIEFLFGLSRQSCTFRRVPCSYTSCLYGTFAKLSFYTSLFGSLATALIYLILWLIIRKELRVVGHEIASTREHNVTHRVLTSVLVISSVVLCGWSVTAGAKTLLQFVTLSGLWAYVAAIYAAFPMWLATGLNFPIMYLLK